MHSRVICTKDHWSRRRARVTMLRRAPGGPTKDAAGEAWLERAQQTPGVRVEKVQALRAALASGAYDLEARLAMLAPFFESDAPSRAAPDAAFDDYDSDWTHEP